MPHCARVIAIVSVFNHRVKQLSKHLIGQKSDSYFASFFWDPKHKSLNPNLVALLISRNHADGLDERMSGIVHPGLDALVQSPVVGGFLVSQVGINGWRERCCHTVIVLP